MELILDVFLFNEHCPCRTNAIYIVNYYCSDCIVLWDTHYFLSMHMYHRLIMPLLFTPVYNNWSAKIKIIWTTRQMQIKFTCGKGKRWAAEANKYLSKIKWQSTFLHGTHTHNSRSLKIDMTSILRSFPVCFLGKHQWEGEAQTVVLLPYRPKSTCHFQKL